MKKYYIKLIDRIFAALYLYENEIDNFQKYVSTLCFELSGIQDNPSVFQIRFKLTALTVNEVTHSQVRKTVFECIDLIDKIVENWSDGDSYEQ